MPNPVLFDSKHAPDLRRMISIRECLEIMHSGAIFSLKYISYDERRPDKNGRVLCIEEGKLVWGSEKADKPQTRALTDLEKQLVSFGAKDDMKKNPDHRSNYTRNIRNYYRGVPTEDIRKVHPPLIIEFNGQQTMA